MTKWRMALLAALLIQPLVLTANVCWVARWIGASPDVPDAALSRTFSIAQNVRRATLHITGLGFYEAYVNGRKVGEKVLDPAPTDYNRRVLFSSYSIEGLTVGTNVLQILLGHGWYDLRSHAAWNFDAAPWRDRPKAIAQLEVEYDDGSRQTIATDAEWELVESPIVYDCLREGEIFDARKTFGRKLGRQAVEVSPPNGLLESVGDLPGAKKTGTTVPREIRNLGDGRWLVIFPETTCGWIALTMRGLQVDDVISVRYDENLGSDGGPAVSSEGDYKAALCPGTRKVDCFFKQSGSHERFPGMSGAQTDRFISNGGEVELFEPRFVYHGFRYALIDGLRAPLRPEDVCAVSVRTAFAETGSFSCSDASLTELVRMALNSFKANLTDGVPTDCPHREKLGWTGDGWIASEVGLTYFDIRSVYRKWLRDILDTQRTDGSLCAIAPTSGWGYQEYSGPVFNAAIAVLPYNLFRYSNDRRGIDEAYPALVRYLEYERTLEKTPGLVDNGLGDWNSTVRAHMPDKEYVVSCLYLRIKKIAAEFASILGRSADADEFLSSATKTREALRLKYHKASGVFDNGGQTAQALAVVCRLFEIEERETVAQRLVEAVESTDCHVDCGLVGSKFLYRALGEIGRADLAYRILVNPTAPSMMKWIGQNGTLWEDWGDGFSKCHVMFADYAAWAMEYLAGIRRPSELGSAELCIAPTPVAGLVWARGSTMTPLGRVSSSWSLEEDDFTLVVTVPSAAKVCLPDGTVRNVPSGRHELKSKLGSGQMVRKE